MQPAARDGLYLAYEKNSNTTTASTTFASLDFQLVRRFNVEVLGKKHVLRAGFKVFNATDRFNPRDVQDNVTAPNFGALFNSVRTQLRAKFEFDF
jgi:hypothetical protein